MGIAMESDAPPNDFEQCVAVLCQGYLALERRQFETAQEAFSVALILTRSLPAEDAADMVPLVLFNMSLLQLRLGRSEDSRKIREGATRQFEESRAGSRSSLYQHLMGSVLTGLGDYRRAIPVWERAIALKQDSPVQMGEALWRVGECYGKSGLRDHAAIALRAAAKIFRNYPEDPRLAAILIALGNSLRKGAPDEAERCYQEAAEFHEARAQLESATTAWVNLGVLCSEQGRPEESLAHYQKALRVREQSRGTPPARMGTLQNNIANCYRRMERYEEAQQAVSRAIELLQTEGGTPLAAAYGTRGLIFRDAKRDAEAAEWLRKACREHQKLPSPNLETLAEDLENLAGALKRLHRTGEAAAVDRELSSVRSAMNVHTQRGPEMEHLSVPEGAVLIELGSGSYSRTESDAHAAQKLGYQLMELVKEALTGSYGGHVLLPESTVLMFYGVDAEALFRVMEPTLRSEAVCQGARVTIRQGAKLREMVLPGRVM
jgi:tetratricopeptide (TPR) repeat protein